MLRFAGCLLLVNVCLATHLVAGEEDVVTIEGGAIAFSPDGKWLAGAARDRILTIWNAATGKVVTTLRERPQGIWNTSYSPDGRLLACNHSRVIRLWDLETEKRVGNP